MLLNTRRRALGLLLATAVGLRLLPQMPRALAAKGDCYDSKDFGPWKAQATNAQAGARMTEVKFVDGQDCDLRVDLQVAASFDAKIVVYGSSDATKLTKKFLIAPENRFIARNVDGKEVANEPLCGNCTDIFDNKVSIVLPLATAPLFRDDKACELAVKLGDKEECRFKVECESLRAGLEWASERQKALAELAADDKCNPPEGCFITSACCGMLGLDDRCFELRALRRYRDQVLAERPAGRAAIERYYELAPLILARLSEETRARRLLSIYLRYILPSALAASLGLNALTYRLYARMMEELCDDVAAELRPIGALVGD
jgi:hypothetical protein